MSKYDLEVNHHPYEHQEEKLDDETMESMWKLFVEIGEFWQNNERPEAMKSNFQVFIANRIHFDPNYRNEYRNAREVIDELIKELGERKAYEKLFTDPKAGISPPKTKFARARQLVSNEFIALQLALGGFKAFGGAKNYLGYIGGANIEGDTPYRRFTGGVQ